MPRTSKVTVTQSPVAAVVSHEASSGLSFSEALEALTRGGRVTKAEWGTSDIYLKVVDDKLSIFKTDDNLFHPLIVSLADMVGTDWIVLKDQ